MTGGRCSRHTDMTVTNSQNSITYAGNAATTVFSFSFIGVNANDITVTYTDPNGNVTVLAPGTYSISFNAPVPPALWGIGGTVTYNPATGPIPNGSQLNISRTIPYTQLTQFANQGASYPSATEMTFDLLAMQVQQINQALARCFSVYPTDPNPTIVQPVAVRKNTQAQFDSNGNLTSGLALSGATVSAAMVPVVTASTIAAALLVLGVPSFYNFFTQASCANVTNAYTITLSAGSPPLSGYFTGCVVEFQPNATPTGNITVQVAALGQKNVYWADGVTQVSTEIVSGQKLLLYYDATLNSAAGAWVIFFLPSNVFTGLAGSYTTANITVDKFGRITTAATGSPGASFPSGTAMLFQQTAAPTGWTKVTTFNDAVLRIVSGTAASGGANTFSSVQAQTATGNTTISVAQMPAHTHGYQGGNWNGAFQSVMASGNSGASPVCLTSGSTGSGGAHNHSIIANTLYVDSIIATKN